MKDDHLTLRLPRELARALARWARERGVAKSHAVREAVARYLSSGAVAPDAPAKTVTAAGLAARWPQLPRLTTDEAADFGRDVDRARGAVPEARDAWE